LLVPLELQIWGEVKAGKTQQDELAVYLQELDDNVPTEIIPQTKRTDSIVFLLRVVGKSMEHEGIFDGDYVIVEKFHNDEGPKENEMIVTLYLPQDAEKYAEQGFDWSDEWFVGPTLKFYSRRNVNGKIIHRLSWRKDINKSPYTIETGHFKPLGRVVGVYRVIQ
jgi:signal peptidase I